MHLNLIIKIKDMKKIIIPVLTVLVLGFVACDLKQMDPGTYNDSLVGYDAQLMAKLDSLELILDSNFETEEADKAFETCLAKIDEVIKLTEEMGAFKGDDKFQKAGLEFFNEVKSLVENEYKEIYELYKIPEDKLTEAEINKMNDVWAKIDASFDEKRGAFIEAQKNFADTYDFIVKDE